MAHNTQVRRHLLPTYSHIDANDDSSLLLANISQQNLNEEQLNIRKTYGYYEPFLVLPSMNSVDRKLAFLSRLWNINYIILQHNVRRLIKISNLYGANRIHRFSMAPHQVYLYEYDYYLALEFFLQFDQHLFYMKTCSYGGATRLYGSKSLLSTREPQVIYGMTRCKRLSCCLCHPLYKLTYRLDTPVVQFNRYQQHQFPNNYSAILNCPATCTTRNIIYVLTCPCKRVHYIGESRSSLPERLAFHQRHGNRIMQEFLLGKNNINRIREGETKSDEILTKDSMALYRHSTQCFHAMQWFLDENPEYWPFIPTKSVETNLDNNLIENTTQESIDKRKIEFTYANDVPQPPANYHFTYQQKIEIEQYFYKRKYLGSPNLRLDLYEAAIITVLPYFGSDTVRKFIEALFITHTEAQLNSDGHLDTILYPDLMNTNESMTSMQDISCCCCSYEKLIHRFTLYE